MLSTNEEQILFHTLGFSYKPYWNEYRKETRNWFGIYPSQKNNDYLDILSLVNKGYMEQKSYTPYGEAIYSATSQGEEYVIKLWTQKKIENKPNKNKRRYQAYLCWASYYEGTFKDFLYWLKNDSIVINDFKKRWEI